MSASAAVAVTTLAFATGDENNFWVGSEDGAIYQGARHGTKSGVLERSSGHHGPVTSLSVHPHLNNVFLSSSVDWTAKIWNYKVKKIK